MNSERALAPGVAPPERINLGDLVIRRWQSPDAEAILRAIEASYDQIHAWMPWLDGLPTLARQQEFVATVAVSWPVDGNCNYGLFDPRGTLLGALGLHDRVGRGTLEIGYWRHTGHTGRGVIT